MNSNTSETVDGLIDQLNDLKLRSSIENDPKARDDAVLLSRKLLRTLEKPEKVAADMIYSPLIPIAVRIAADMNLFKLVVDKAGPITSQELASLSGGEEQFIVRLLRTVTPMGFLDEAGERVWQATPMTVAMTSEGISGGYKMVGDLVLAAAQKAPEYLKESEYRCPTDPNDGFVQYAFQTKLSTFDLIGSLPHMFRDFNAFMGRTAGARKKWLEWYDVPKRLINGAKPDTPLFVDIGGGKGHDTIRFQEVYPNSGRLVLQDLAPVIASIEDLPSGIDGIPYDFFTPQPVKSSRAYFYHHIFHDWSDQKSLEILEQVVKAMKPGYSKLLIHEMIVPDIGAPIDHAMLDMAMLFFNSGMERTARDWRQLLEKAGLEVIEIWPGPEESAAGLVEAMLKEPRK